MYALVDCNSFFCSCERLFRPDLASRPVGVLSNNDGCFISRTEEFKRLGVPMGAPYFKYKKLCDEKNVAVFSANFPLYTNISDRVMLTLSQFTPALEVYSVDEAFLDLRGMKKLEAYAHSIKETLWKEVGVPVSVGIAPTKTLAKAANHIAKMSHSSNGVLLLTDEKIRDRALELLPISEVWGVGKSSVSKFQSLQIKTAKDFRDYPNKELVKKIFTKVGLQRKEELQGKPRFELQTTPVKKKGISSSRSFGSGVKDFSSLREAVSQHISKACADLREQGSVCQGVSVQIRDSYFREGEHYSASEHKAMLSPTSDTRKVIKYAVSALEKLYKQGYDYKKAGVRLSGLSHKETQMSLFESPDSIKSQNLMKAIDLINQKEGEGTVKVLSCGVETEAAWKARASKLSPRYVSGWTELPKVK